MPTLALIRPARPDELETVQRLEVRAGQRFRAAELATPALDLAALADAPPLPLAVLERARRDGALWILAGPQGDPRGFAVTSIVDGHAHLDELSVAPAHGGQGHGSRLLEHVCAIARAAGRTHLTLTTFRAVPWNAPFYARRGFTALRADALGPELRARVDEEQARGLSARHRVCMVRALGDSR